MKASVSRAACKRSSVSSGLRNSEHCKHPARARLRDELLQTNQAALNQHAQSFSRPEARPSCRRHAHMKGHLTSKMGKGNEQRPSVMRITILRGGLILRDASQSSPSTPKDDIHFSFSGGVTSLITERGIKGALN